MDNQVPQQPIPPMPTNDPVNAPPAMPPTAPPASPQHTHTLLFIAIVAGVIILLLTSILFVVFLSSNRRQVSTNTLPTAVPTKENEIVPSTTILSPTTTSTTIDTSTWKMYTDTGGYFTYQHPATWTVKQGFDFENDIIVYDPQSMKNRPTFKGNTVLWPDHFVNVVSVEASSTTAKKFADEYITSWNKTNKEANRVSLTRNGVEYEFYDVLGEASLKYRNVAISNGKVLILLTTSANTLEDKTIESSIIQSLKVTK